MQDEWIQQVSNTLVGKGALACTLKEDGCLSVIDHEGRKHLFLPADYRHLLPKPTPSKSTRSKNVHA